jgi:hypothetical protein
MIHAGRPADDAMRSYFSESHALDKKARDLTESDSQDHQKKILLACPNELTSAH